MGNRSELCLHALANRFSSLIALVQSSRCDCRASPVFVSRRARTRLRDKLRIAQLLIQLARREEEEQTPEQRKSVPRAKPDPELIQSVADRLRARLN